MIEMPVWFEYIVWGQTDAGVPYVKGLKKDTPEEIIQAFKREFKEMQKYMEENPDVRLV